MRLKATLLLLAMAIAATVRADADAKPDAHPEPDHDGSAVVDRFGWPADPVGSTPSSLFGQTSDLTPARLTDDGPKPSGGGALRRRERGASKVPIGEGRPVAASNRSPEEVRSLLSRYRNGLRRGGKRLTGSADPDPAGEGDAPDQSHPNTERR